MRKRVLSEVVGMMLTVLVSVLPLSAAHEFNGSYDGANLGRVAFPIGGIGAGMYCLEGYGAISSMSVWHHLEFFHEPSSFAAVCILGSNAEANVTRVLEGPIPDWKYFGQGGSANGAESRTYGFPRFRNCSFLARFPFATIQLSDKAVPVSVEITGWSPFTPPDPNPSSLPAGALEYKFKNTSSVSQRAVFSFNTRNFMGKDGQGAHKIGEGSIGPLAGGFVLYAGTGAERESKGAFAFAVDEETVHVDHCWFRGGWWDPLTIAWQNVAAGRAVSNPPVLNKSPGASLSVPFDLKPGEERVIRLHTCWYVPGSDLKCGRISTNVPPAACEGGSCAGGGCPSEKIPPTYVPWYSTQFNSIQAVVDYWRANYTDLRRRSVQFKDAFYDTTLPLEAVEAIAANLTILKTPTVLRQQDGRLWCWEGCSDNSGCCEGSCAHVWNYAQAICHLFPELSRGMRRSIFYDGQKTNGSLAFRVNLPLSPGGGAFDAADGSLGEIMQVHREWRLAGDDAWLKRIWPQVKTAMEYAMRTWDPRGTGLLEEDHHNTYDINYFGPDGHCGSFYLGALAACIRMGEAAGDDVIRYRELLSKGRKRMETELFNGEYFVQLVRKDGLNRNFNPINPDDQSEYYRDVAKQVNEEGPKYQYGTGCLSDGVLGLWMARVCGIEEDLVDPKMVLSHLQAVYKYNLKHDLSEHANPQRPSYAMGNDGGLLLCSWPRGGKPLLPFVYSDEVWTGIEYQFASHLIMLGKLDEGLDVVRTCRQRHTGVRRNPFDEYECGHWYARAMSSYALLQALSGIRYDAGEKVLHVQPSVKGDYRSFLSTASGYGTAGLRDGKPFVDVVSGKIDVKNVK